MNPLSQAILDECRRQEENCAYTALSFTIWLRNLRARRTASLVLPVIFGALATWQIVTQNVPALGAVCTLLATVIPLVYRASRTDGSIERFTQLAGEFTNLRDRFRQAATISVHRDAAEFERDLQPLMERLEKARAATETPPEWCFRQAREKIKAGHYHHDYDETPGK